MVKYVDFFRNFAEVQKVIILKTVETYLTFFDLSINLKYR